MQQQAQSVEQLDAADLEAELEAAQSPRKHLDMALYAQGCGSRKTGAEQDTARATGKRGDAVRVRQNGQEGAPGAVAGFGVQVGRPGPHSG
jgi:hypothetical protein